ncbi:6422_t:CDS:10 [Ambispora leptoticha]|uniref:Spindle pole body component n=1 Tax=Ambispora leptoticha TaxID=144679 RepID=A0A9N8VTC2_9GLOM|nr:6422_t:CDS:10 [Ambispora leptoticha]
MNADNINKLTEQLIQHITNIPQGTYFEKCKANSLSTFKYHNFGSNNENEVFRRYKGLVEKFRIHAQYEKAKSLDNCIKSFVENPLETISNSNITTRFAILAMLLALSDLPLKSHYVPMRPKLSKIKSNQTVAQIFKERPLTGAHWRSVSYLDDDEDEEDWDVDQDWIRERLSDNNVLPSESEQNELEKIDMGVHYFKTMTYRYDCVKELESLQYWRSDCRNNIYFNMKIEFDINNPCTLGPSVDNHLSKDPRNPFKNHHVNVKFISELEAIREVLFVLSGRPGLLFSKKNHNGFQVEIKAKLTHLSEGAFKNLLQYFCDQANAIAKVRGISYRICKSDCSKYGMTSQAFADSILQMISKFEKVIGEMEYEYNAKRVRSEHTIASLLQLRNRLSNYFFEFEILYSFVVNTPLKEIPELEYTSTSNEDHVPSYHPWEFSYAILSGLYAEIIRHQIAGNTRLFVMLGRHFDNAFEPYMRIIDKWIKYGSLDDPADEFFIVKNSKVVEKSGNHWQEMFIVREAIPSHKNTPTVLHSLDFLGQFVNRIMFAGKGRNLLMSLNFSKDSKDKKLYASSNAEIGIEKLRSFDLLTFQPFHQRFADNLEDYLQPQYEHINDLLYKTLVDRCHLWAHLRTLSGIYFMQEGESIHRLCDLLFDRMDRRQLWYDSYVLNEIFINTLKNLDWLPNGVISARIDDNVLKRPDITNMRIFEKIMIECRLPWPINNIIQADSLQYYKQITIFLLQIRRAKYLVERMAFSRLQNEQLDPKSREMKLFYGIRLNLIWFLNTIWDYLMGMTKPAKKAIFDILNLTIQFTTLYARYLGENVSFYDHHSLAKDSGSDSGSDFTDEDSDDLDEDDEVESDVDHYVPMIVDRQAFWNGLQRIDREFTRHKDFVISSVKTIGRVSGVSFPL